MCDTHHYDVYVTRKNDERMVAARRRVGSIRQDEPAIAIGEGAARLFIEIKDHWFSLGFWDVNNEKYVLAQGEAALLSKEIAGGFTGIYLAMFAQGTGSADTASMAWFDYFDYQIV